MQQNQTVYQKRRISVFNEFINFCQTRYGNISQTNFFLLATVHEFLDKYPRTNKSLVVTHLNAIMKHVANSANTNLMKSALDSNFNLKNIPLIRHNYTVNKSKSVSRNMSSTNPLEFNTILTFIKNHANHDQFGCQFILQTLTGIRMYIYV